MQTILNLDHLLGSVVYSLLGFILLAAAYLLVEKLTPTSITKELLEEHNTALAIVVGAVVIGLSLIISSAIIG